VPEDVADGRSREGSGAAEEARDGRGVEVVEAVELLLLVARLRG
jgi:hypothetical protein